MLNRINYLIKLNKYTTTTTTTKNDIIKIMKILLYTVESTVHNHRIWITSNFIT